LRRIALIDVMLRQCPGRIARAALADDAVLTGLAPNGIARRFFKQRRAIHGNPAQALLPAVA